MTRIMYDSVDASRIPPDATMAACYVDGRFANEPAVRARVPHARIVTITVLGTPGAKVADIERGDLSPYSGASWAKNELSSGRLPTLYCNLSTWPDVQDAVHAAGIDGQVSYWIAQYNAQAEMIPGAVAHQYQERTDQNLDYSIVADYWPGVDSVPSHVPPFPLPQGACFHQGVHHVALDMVYRHFALPVPADHVFNADLYAKVGHFMATNRVSGTPGVIDRTVWTAIFSS